MYLSVVHASDSLSVVHPSVIRLSVCMDCALILWRSGLGLLMENFVNYAPTIFSGGRGDI